MRRGRDARGRPERRGEEYRSELAMNDGVVVSVRGNRDARVESAGDVARRGRDETGGHHASGRGGDRVAGQVHAFAVAITYVVTLSIFPGVLAEDLRDDAIETGSPSRSSPRSTWRTSSGSASLGCTRLRRPRLVRGRWRGRRRRACFRAGVLRCRGMVRRRRGGGRGCARAWGDQRLVQRERDDDGAEGLERGGVQACGTIMVFFLLSGLTIGAFCGWLWLV